MSDWSGVDTGDLITIHHAFESRFEHEDVVIIQLNRVSWSRCYTIMYEIAHELEERREPDSV